MKLSEQVAELERENAELELDNTKLQEFTEKLTKKLERKEAFVKLMSPYMAVVLGKEDVLTKEFTALAKAYRAAMDG